MTATRKDSPLLRWIDTKIVEVLGADLRSLALFRIVLALLVLADLAGRIPDLPAHYTDEGVLPRSVLLQEVLSSSALSLNLVNGTIFSQVLLFGVAALAALALLIGYRTRLMIVIVWVLLLSIQWRNPLVLSGSDTLLRILLFWGMFLPLGAYWSVDRALKAAPPRTSMRFVSLATVGLFFQIAFVYWFAVILKSGPEWRVDGTALYYALNWDHVATPIATYLLNFPALLTVLTFATLGLEAFGPFLLFSPFLTGPVRTGTILAFMSLHFGIWLTMDIGLFPLVSAFCMVCFLPSWFWDKAASLRQALPERANFMRGLQRTLGRLNHAYWSPLLARLSSTAGVGRPSVAGLVVQGGGDQLGSQDSRKTAPERATSPGAAAAVSEPAMLQPSLAVNLLAAFFLVYIFCSNLTSVSEFEMPEPLDSLETTLGIGQYWSMFAPQPPSVGGWYVIPGNLKNGQQVDLMGVIHDDFRVREGVSWEKPQSVLDTYENIRWRKYLEEIDDEDHEDLRQYFGSYICREWDTRHADTEEIENFQIIYMKTETLLDNRRTTPEKVLLWEQTC